MHTHIHKHTHTYIHTHVHSHTLICIHYVLHMCINNILTHGSDVLVAKSCLTLVTPWNHQAPLSMGYPNQDYWSGLPFPSPEDLPDPGIKPRSLADSLLYCRWILYQLSHQGSLYMCIYLHICMYTSVCIYIYIYICIYTLTHIYTNTNPYIHLLTQIIFCSLGLYQCSLNLNIKYPCKPNVWLSSISFFIALSRLCPPPTLSLSQSRGITLAVMFSMWCSQLLPIRQQKDWNLRCLWMLELDSVD